jgi:hypothetical protein
MDRRSGAGQIKNSIDFQKDRKRDVVANTLEMLIVE